MEVMLGGEPAVLQAPTLDCQSLDPFTSFYDCGCPAETGSGGQEVVFQQHAALQRLCQRSILPWVWGRMGAPRMHGLHATWRFGAGRA